MGAEFQRITTPLSVTRGLFLAALLLLFKGAFTSQLKRAIAMSEQWRNLFRIENHGIFIAISFIVYYCINLRIA